MTEPLWSDGGPGGVHAVLEDLEVATRTLVGAAEDLEDAARALAVAAGWATWRPERQMAAAPLQDAAAASSREAAALRDLAASLGVAAEAYLDAEFAARQRLSVATRLGEAAQDHAAGVWWRARALGAVALGLSPGGLLASHALGIEMPREPPPTTGMLGRDETSAALDHTLDEHYAPVVAALAHAVRALEGAYEPDYLSVEAGAAVASEAPADLEDVMGRLGWLHAQGEGTVAIETVVGPGEAGTRHLVYVPGTQDWGVGDANPADLEADLAGVLGGTSDAARAVVDAVAAHGIAEDEPVLIAGHSQGGIVATLVAAALAERFADVRVVTAGAPTGRIVLPAGVPALHLENTRDLVPGLDGRANPATPTRVTVSHDRRRSARDDAPDGSRTVAEAHGIAGYAATARLVDEHGTASTRAWLAGAGPMLAGGSSTVTAYRPVTR